MANRDLIVRIVGDDRSLRRAFLRSEEAGKKFSLSMGTVAKASLGFFAISSAADLVSRSLHASISEFAEQQKVAAQTNAALKSTGGVAGVTADHIQKLANSVMRYSGIDDEAAQAGENLLLTFRNIRNEVGKGNDIFDQATASVVDLSVALHQDLEGSAIRLGKALNDPVKGVTALRRVGIQFTTAQEKTIKSLVESNRLLEAQKIILKEVQAEVGGSARAYGETLPGQIDILQQKLLNVGGALVKFGVVIISEFTQTLLASVSDIIFAFEKLTGLATHIPGVGDKFKGIESAAHNARASVDKFNAALRDSSIFGEQAGTTITGAFNDIADAFAAVGKKFGPKKTDTTPKGFELPFRLQREEAFAATTKSISDDLAVARKVRDHINKLISSGSLKGQRLIDALGELASANSLIAGAQQDAAAKTAASTKTHADAVKAAAEKQTQAAQDAARKLRDATDQARTEIGTLFQGPLLAPTDADRRRALGLPGPDPSKILGDIRAQTALALRFERDLRRLGRAGVGQATITELRGLGTGAIPQIEAILGTRGGQRRDLIQALLGRERAARRIGQMIVHTPLVQLHARQVVIHGGSGSRTLQATSRSGRFAGVN